MMVRTPTRTKTRSFEGPQGDFKFPSNYSFANIADNTTTVDPHRIGGTLHTVSKVRSRSSSRSSSRGSTQRITAQRTKPKSQLKRSPSIRCKGGLLNYFSELGRRLRRKLRRLRLMVRGVLRLKSSQKGRRSKTNDPSFSSVTSPSSFVQVLEPVSALSDKTSMRSASFVKSISPSTPKTETPVSPKLSTIRSSSTAYATDTSGVLRRTHSSIRRAVAKTPSRLVRSPALGDLDRVARQPSIVVRNNVIPLTHHYAPIREEEPDATDSSEYESVSDALPQEISKERVQEIMRAYLTQVITNRIQFRLTQDAATLESPLDPISSIISQYASSSSRGVSTGFAERFVGRSLTLRW